MLKKIQKISLNDSSIIFRQKILLLSSLIFVAAFLLYTDSLNYDYVLDDLGIIKGNEFVESGTGIFSQLFNKPPENLSRNGDREGLIVRHFYSRPVTAISFALEHALWGYEGSRLPRHLLNVLLYALLCSLIFILLNKLFKGKILIPLIATLVYMVHPIHVEVVANIKSRDEIFAVLFGLVIPLILILKYVEKRRLIYLLLSYLSYLFGVFSKENALIFFMIIPLALFLVIDDKKEILRLALPFLFISLLSLTYSISLIGFNISAKENFIQNILNGATNWQERFATPFYVIFKYFTLLLYPYPQSWDYSYSVTALKRFSDPYALTGLLISAIALIYALLRMKNRNYYTFSILFFFIAIFLNLNIIIITGAIMGERFLFTPSLGFTIILALIADRLIKIPVKYKINYLKIGVLSLLGAIVLTYTFMTINRSGDFRNNDAILNIDIQTYPNSTIMNIALANDNGYKSSLQTDPVFKREYMNSCIAYWEKCLEVYPYNEYWSELARIYVYTRDFPKARDAYLRGIKFMPRNKNLWLGLGVSSINLNLTAAARAPFSKFVQYDTANVDYSEKLSLQSFFEGKEVKLKRLKTAVSNNNLNDLLALSQYYMDELRDYKNANLVLRQASILAPDNTSLLILQGDYFYNLHNFREAIQFYSRAIERNSSLQTVLNKIAISYIKMGDFDKAIYYYQLLPTATSTKNN